MALIGSEHVVVAVVAASRKLHKDAQSADPRIRICANFGLFCVWFGR